MPNNQDNAYKNMSYMGKKQYFYSMLSINGYLPIALIITVFLGFLSGCTSNTTIPISNQTTPAKKITYGFYIVKKGDTMSSIALSYGWRYQSLALLNQINVPYTLHIGQKIYFYRGIKEAKHRRSVEKKSSIVARKLSKSRSVDPVVQKKPSKSYVVDKIAKKSKSRPPSSANVRLKQGIAWQWPIMGKIIKLNTDKSLLTKGINIDCKIGDTVRAAASGKIVYAGNGLRGYGLLIIIKHNDNFLSAYAHNSTLKVKEGQWIAAGQVIAEAGSTGTVRPILHFEIRRHGKPVDPLQYLPKN